MICTGDDMPSRPWHCSTCRRHSNGPAWMALLVQRRRHMDRVDSLFILIGVIDNRGQSSGTSGRSIAKQALSMDKFIRKKATAQLDASHMAPYFWKKARGRSLRSDKRSFSNLRSNRLAKTFN